VVEVAAYVMQVAVLRAVRDFVSRTIVCICLGAIMHLVLGLGSAALHRGSRCFGLEDVLCLASQEIPVQPAP
jgi:hypothetical protein